MGLAANLWFKELRRSSLFEIKKVKIKGDTGWLESSARFIIGDNLFSADLNKVAYLLRKEHPEIETVVVSKLWPDMISIRFTLRKPLAVIVNGQELLIDEDGALLEKNKYNHARYKAFVANLPVIEGLILKPAFKVGRLSRNAQLLSAFEIIKLFSQSSLARDYRLVHISVKYLPETAVLIQRRELSLPSAPLLIKLGERPYSEKLKMFEIFLKKANIDLKNVEYIDLRFKEPVAGMKNG
jgi:cell division septal protein FtsQ